MTAVRPALVLLLLALVHALLPAQEPERALRDITLEMAIGSPGAFYANAPPGLAWHPDGEDLSWCVFSEGEMSLVRGPARGGEARTVLTASALARVGREAGLERVSPLDVIRLSWGEDGRSLRLRSGRALYRVDPEPLRVRRLLELPEGATDEVFSPGDRQVAWVRDHDVHVRKADGTTRAVTHEGHAALTHGIAVSRREMGITDGLWWGPRGRRLAFYREDLRVEDPYPVTDYDVLPARNAPVRYPMAGRRGSIVSVGVYDSRDDSVRWLKTDPTVDEYLTNVTWGPKGERLYVAHVNRDQNRTTLTAWDAATGERIADLFTEADDEWTEPESGPVFLPDGSRDFLWFSSRDGFRQLYRYDAAGTLAGRVTQGSFDILSFERFDAGGRGFFFVGTGGDARQRHLFHASLDGAQHRITRGEGQHEPLISPDGGLVVDRRSALETPMVVDLLDAEGALVRTIHEAKDPLLGFRRPQQRFFDVRTADGVTLHGHLILPPEMEEGRRYPVIQYVYGGPHGQLVHDTWLGGRSHWMPWLHYLASRGYVVFRVDNRGTPHRGSAFEQAVFRRLGELEVADQVAGLDHVCGLGFADPERVAVHGWSYGGYMTLSLMTRAGDRYRAGVAGAPVTDWRYYETGYTERYMDTPQANPDGYEKASPIAHLDGLAGRLLVVHGSSDETVVLQHTMEFVDRCIEAGKDVTYMVYPGQKHGFEGKAFDHVIRKMTRWFEEQLAR